MYANPPQIIFRNLKVVSCEVISCLSFCKFISLLALKGAGNRVTLSAFHYRAICQRSSHQSREH
ncbi:hypothetical protein [Enterobacter hormaechei]|uniref:hypothetical protein n=1 Tax=Enterobacter hormaechei TaxID=158836 RepID=UPI00073CA2D6|nr:hypothetical protein [Enterobacter hormaechei]KTG98703.1 hypothetical protein ASV33_15940 [Enterobacter hormaechei subsp. xiangfangensis]